MTLQVFQRVELDFDGLMVNVEFQPLLSYALVHNGVPPVRRLTVRNTTTDSSPPFALRLDLLGPGALLSEPFLLTVEGGLAAGAGVVEDASVRGSYTPRPEQVRLRDFGMRSGDLAALNEAFPAEYVVTVARAGRQDLAARLSCRVLAHNEWFNTPGLRDVLAAFVQPNTVGVESVLRTASKILVAHTGSGSLQGYQAGSDRVVQIGGAVYEALRQAQITYQGVPASFEDTGQKVRTTSAVLAGHLGNCVDLSVTYAACLEQAGLHPMIWLAKGHAFGGFLVGEKPLEASEVATPNLLASMVDAQLAIPVELTGIGPGERSSDFRTAVEMGRRNVRDPQARLLGAVDVHRARLAGIRPLPSPDDAPPPRADAATPVQSPRIGAIDLPSALTPASLPAEDELTADDEAPAIADDAPLRVQQWKKALLDLSLRNPLLNLPRRGKGLDLHLPAGSLAVLDDLVHDRKALHLLAQDAFADVHALAGARTVADLPDELVLRELSAERRVYASVTKARYQAAMRGLQREARTMTQETGSNYLYLTLGTLVHRKSTGQEAHAPLFLLPVRIEGGSGRRPYTMVADGPEVAVPNHCLVEWLRVKHGVTIPELENPAHDESGIDIPRTLAAISARLVANHLDYRIDEAASLRLLQFATFQMWRDLTDNWAAFAQNPIVRHLVETPGTRFIDPVGDTPPRPVDEADLHLSIPADGSQMQAVVMAEQGRSFVLEGPPGTGKSQTITNMIAQALAAGRTVLFVAEKQAALDVVKRRLTAIGLAPFSLDLHGRKQTMTAIRDQLRAAIDVQGTDDRSTWTAVETAYRTRLGPLVRYPEQVHGENAVGLSTWTAYETTLAYGTGPVAPVPHAYLGADDATRARVDQALRELPAAAQSARLRPQHPWAISGLRTLDGVDAAAVAHAAADLEGVRQALAKDDHLTGLVGALADPEDVSFILPAARVIAQRRLPDRTTTSASAEPGWDDAVAQYLTDLQAFRDAFAGELQRFRPEVFGVPDLDRWHTEAREAAGRLIGKGRHLQAVADQLAPWTRSGTPMAGDTIVAALGRLVAARAQARDLHRRAHELPGLPLPSAWLPTNPDAVEYLDAARHAAVTSRELLNRLPHAWAALSEGMTVQQVALLEYALAAWRTWRGLLSCMDGELLRWAREVGWFAAWQRDGGTWYADTYHHGLLAIQRWGALLAHLDALRAAGLGECAEQLLDGRLDPATVESAYGRGVAVTALTERRHAGGLEYFDAAAHEAQVTGFQNAAHQLRVTLPEHLPATLVRRRPFSAQERHGRVADFGAELRRKRGGRSFRELFSAYPDIVLALTPCVLVSPASAATFLAPDAARFDVVIFDEASQIRVAEAIGAMGRANSAVIVGDSKQMPPTTIMQSHGGDDSAGIGDGVSVVPEDLDSILSESVESLLPRHGLTWHYRSQDETLIVFSNRHYYDNELSSLPSPGHRPGTGVMWQRVDGRFDRGGTRTNQLEAEAVVAEITRRLHEPDPDTDRTSIGVVTFNIQQRDLILDLLEDSPDPLVREHLKDTVDEPIFVKNLENVQGDERDVILFSLAFSTDPETGLLPLNFGPLSQVGGERRLNVAVTRARRQVILFASFDPQDIDLNRTQAVGTRHLRLYCEMAAAGVHASADLATRRADRRDRVRDAVAEAIRARGHEVTTNHGLSDFTVDLAVRAAGAPHWQVAVMLDGPRWRARPTVADRDCAPTLLRDIMHWPRVVRFWLPAWLLDPDTVLDGIDTAVAEAVAEDAERETAREAARHAAIEEARLRAEAAAEADIEDEPGEAASAARADDADPLLGVSASEPGPDAETTPEAVTPAVVRLPTQPRSDTAPAGADRYARHAAPRSVDDRPVSTAQSALAPSPTGGPEPFVPFLPTTVGDRSDIDTIRTNQRVQAAVRQRLGEVLAAEGPIEERRLARLTLQGFGFAKTHEDRRMAVLELLDPRWTRTDHGGAFIWPDHRDPKTWTGFRQSRASTDRDFEEIPPEEIANALCHAAGAGRSEADLLRAALELLGYRRMTEKIEGRLRLGLRQAMDTGLVAIGPTGRFQIT
jgi:hypothetical protein